MDTIWTTQGFPEMTFAEMQDPGRAGELISRWVSEHLAEDLYLDFKRKSDPATGAPNDDDRRNYAKALSGFANSDGGLIVWGVVAEKEDNRDPESSDVARDVVPIFPLNTFVTSLNDITAYSTKPAVPGVQNLPVETEPGNDAGYVVTYVPAGLNPPYRAENDCNNNYYRRSGSRFHPLEPYELRDIVFRFRYPKLDLHLYYSVGKIEHHVHEYALEVSITNRGPTALKDYKIAIAVPLGVDTKHHPGAELWRSEELLSADGGMRYNELSAILPPKFTVYPGEYVTIVGRGRPLRMSYWVTAENYETHGIVSFTVYGTDMPPVVSAKPFREMHNF